MIKVKSIKKIDNEDVYNMQVDNHHNFSINGGFIVHNCDALRGFCIERTKSTVVKSNEEIVKQRQIEYEYRNRVEAIGQSATKSFISYGG